MAIVGLARLRVIRIHGLGDVFDAFCNFSDLRMNIFNEFVLGFGYVLDAGGYAVQLLEQGVLTG